MHYGRGYDNAFWDGTQMVFGDGDGTVFNRFTIAVDVIGHELTHGVTEHTAALVYQGQSGALNESISDVFGSLVKQQALGQDAAAADWLIGAGLFTAQVKGVALRSMKAPGTAYDDPQLGKDPQPATMADYVETTDDNGGVHLNSGIPNHAFYLAATAIGGHAWEVRRAGLVRRAHRRPADRHRRLRDLRAAHRRGRRAPVCRGLAPGDRHPDRVGAGRRAHGRRRPPRTSRPVGADVAADPATLRPRDRRPTPSRYAVPRRRPRCRCGAPAGWPVSGEPAPSPSTSCPTRTPRAGGRCWPSTGSRSWPRHAADPAHPRRLHLPRGVPPGR